MRIAVVGAGGAHLAAMKTKGLKVEGGRGEAHIAPTQATDDPADGVRSISLRQAVGRRERRR